MLKIGALCLIFLFRFLPVEFGNVEFLRQLGPVRADSMWPTEIAVGKSAPQLPSPARAKEITAEGKAAIAFLGLPHRCGDTGRTGGRGRERGALTEGAVVVMLMVRSVPELPALAGSAKPCRWPRREPPYRGRSPSGSTLLDRPHLIWRLWVDRLRLKNRWMRPNRGDQTRSAECDSLRIAGSVVGNAEGAGPRPSR